MNYLQKHASRGLVLFVFGCTIIIIGLLYLLQKAEATRDSLDNKQSSRYEKYLD